VRFSLLSYFVLCICIATCCDQNSVEYVSASCPTLYLIVYCVSTLDEDGVAIKIQFYLRLRFFIHLEGPPIWFLIFYFRWPLGRLIVTIIVATVVVVLIIVIIIFTSLLLGLL